MRETVLENISIRNEQIERLFALAKEENISIDRVNVKNKLRRYSTEDIERVIDAFERFGIRAITNSL